MHSYTDIHVHNVPGRPKNRGHFVLRPMTLEILNRSLPNLAQITASSFWTSCHNLFESILENNGAIWRITLTVNKKAIKVMNWQWLRHALVSAMLLTIALLILSTEEQNLMMVDRLLKSTADSELTVSKSGLFVGQNVWLSELLQFTNCKFLCFWRCEREHCPAAATIDNGHISPWCRAASLASCHAPSHMVARLVEWKRLLSSRCATQRRTP